MKETNTYAALRKGDDGSTWKTAREEFTISYLSFLFYLFPTVSDPDGHR